MDFQSYRNAIVKAILNGKLKVTPSDIPSYILMYSKEPEAIEELLSTLAQNKTITEKFVERVKGVKTEAK